MWLHVPLMLAEAGGSVCKFKARQIYIGSSRRARDIYKQISFLVL